MSIAVFGGRLVKVVGSCEGNRLEVIFLDGAGAGEHWKAPAEEVTRWRPIGAAWLRKQLAAAGRGVRAGRRQWTAALLGEIRDGLVPPVVEKMGSPRRGNYTGRKGPHHGAEAQAMEAERRRRGWTPARMGQALGRSAGAVFKYELGDRRIPAEVWERFKALEGQLGEV
jgi:hypothetical protein